MTTIRWREGLLEALVPGLGARHSRVVLAELPTALTAAPALARRAGVSELWVKREDLTSPHYGGSKVRALEFLLGRVLSARGRGVVTMGAGGSHHVLATAIFARLLGLASRAVLFPQPDQDATARNRAALSALGTEVLATRGYLGVPWALLLARGRDLAGGRPQWIAPGATDALGVLGNAEGALEVAEAIRQGELPPPDEVVVPAGSCGTVAGVLLGFRLAGLSPRITAVRVVPRIVASARRMRRLAAAAEQVLTACGGRGFASWPELRVIHDQLGRGYGHPTDAGREACEVVAGEAGLRADTTYMGKLWAHVLGGGGGRRNLLVWNTLSATDGLGAADPRPPGPI